MTAPRVPVLLATASGLAVGALGVWGWSLDVEPPQLLFFVALPVIWGVAELGQFRGEEPRRGRAIMKWHRLTIAWMGLVLAVRVGPQLAIKAGLLEADWRRVALQASGVLLGAGIAIWGNYLPKLYSPWRLPDEPFDWQGVHRFAGRLAFLVGLALIVVWAALPVSRARPTADAILVAAGALMVVRKLHSIFDYARS